jgi:hypothetical protein
MGGLMNISAPRQITLIISVLIALIALFLRFSGVTVPVLSEHPFGTLFVAYVFLLLGNLVEGI